MTTTEQASQRRELLLKGYRVLKHNLFQTGIDVVQFSQLGQSCFRKSQPGDREQGPLSPSDNDRLCQAVSALPSGSLPAP